MKKSRGSVKLAGLSDAGVRRGVSMAGFTLLELMITISLLAVVAVIVAGALRIGSRAWEKGSQKVAGIEGPRVVLDLLKHQIRSELPHKIRVKGKSFLLFFGDEVHLQFISAASLFTHENNTRVLVTYRVNEAEGEKGLVLSEEDPVRFDFSKFAQKEMAAEGEGIEIADGWRSIAEDMKTFSFAYAGSPEPDGTFKWESTWDGRVLGRLPSAVKLTMQAEEDVLPIDLVVRLPVTNVWATIIP